MLAGMLVMAASFGLLTTVSAGTVSRSRRSRSALNDTIQQAGTALGIAILGSLLASGFSRHLPAGVPAAAPAAAPAEEPELVA